MDSKEIRTAVVDKFNAKSIEFGQIKSSVEAFCVGILVDCKEIITEITDAKMVAFIIIDEIDERTNTGVFDALDGMLARGLFEKLADTPQLEKWFLEMKSKALEIINSNIPKE